MRKKLRYLHDCVHNLSSDCHPALKNAGKRTTDFTYDNACSPAQGDEGKALCKDCCKPIIVTVCNNTEVIHQLLSAVHSSTLVEEQVNGRIHRFFFFPACSTYFVAPLLHRRLCPELCAFCPPILTASLPAASFSTRLRSALRTLLHRMNLTSPLKDWPHTKLLFKGKKYTLRGWKEIAGSVWAHPNGRGSPYELADTGNDPPHPRTGR